MLGANPRAAVHLGIDVPRLIVVAFLISGALIGLAAAVDITGIYGYMRSDWNPAYGLAVVPLVFLARLNALAIIPFAAFFSLLSIGGLYATRRAGLPSDFGLLFTGMMLLFMVGIQFLYDRRSRRDERSSRRASEGPHPMADVLSPSFLTTVIALGITAAVPLLYASLGEILAEQSGVLNVGLEGMMLSGAFVGFIVTLETRELWLGPLAGGVTGALVSLLMVLFCIRLGLDQIVVGIGIVLAAEGATSLLHTTWFVASRPRLPAIDEFAIPVLSDLPILGGSVFTPAAGGLRRARARGRLRLGPPPDDDRPEPARGRRAARLARRGGRQRRARPHRCRDLLRGARGRRRRLPLDRRGRDVRRLRDRAASASSPSSSPCWREAASTGRSSGALLFGMSLSVATALQLVGIAIPTDFVFMLPVHLGHRRAHPLRAPGSPAGRAGPAVPSGSR